MSPPLRGLRVLDLSRVLAGPWCTMLLGDAGANVIKLERTKTGDDTRAWGPPFLGKEEQLSTYYLSVNRNKKSIAVDIKHPEGRDICRRLATEWADVLVENFKVGTMARLGLDYDSISPANPGLIYCSVTGFGPSGPLSGQPGYDIVASGMYGLMSITGDERGSPVKVGVALTDILSGTLAHGGILAALHERNRTGHGQKVDVSLMETQLASLVNIASSSLNSQPNTPPPKRWGTAHESIVPYQTFRCKSPAGNKDQYIVVGAGNDEQFQKFCIVLGLAELAADTRFQTNAGRVSHRDELISKLEEKFMERSRDEWVASLEGKGFPLGPVRSVPEAFECEQAVYRGMVQELDHPVVGKVRLPRSPVSFSSVGRGEVTHHPPMLGEHTEEVLADILKVNASDIGRLERVGVVECWRRNPRSTL
jgi:crotonobetainyl-CoA:carnitine CoA-transferase CaiB-like acyl-CoA transferase